MQFYGYFRSSAAYRCRIAFNLKGVTPEFIPVHLRKGEQRSEIFLAKNPAGLVPALDTGEGLLTQSLAIIEWLEETFPQPPLLPQNPIHKAQQRALALGIACEIHPLQNLRTLNYLREHFKQDQAGIDKWCSHWIMLGLNAFEESLQQQGTYGSFCYGDKPSLADIMLAPQVFSAARFGADISGLKIIQSITHNHAQHPAFIAAHPKNQPDFEA